MVFQTPIPEDSYVREVAGDIDIVRGRKGEGGDSSFPGAGERILLPGGRILSKTVLDLTHDVMLVS